MAITHFAGQEICARPYQEDFYVLPSHDEDLGYRLYALFDGHGGPECARMCAEYVAQTFALVRHLDPTLTRKEQLYKLFQALHELSKVHEYSHVGCTATVVLVEDNEIWTANVGDSSAYLFTQSSGFFELSEMHQPKESVNVREIDRVKSLGGAILGGRVDGVLAVSRAIGDLSLYPKVAWTPWIDYVKMDSSDDTLVVMGSDGLWDCNTPPEVAKLAFLANYDPCELGAALTHKLRNDKRARDNATYIAVSFYESANTSGYTFSKQMNKDMRHN